MKLPRCRKVDTASNGLIGLTPSCYLTFVFIVCIIGHFGLSLTGMHKRHCKKTANYTLSFADTHITHQVRPHPLKLYTFQNIPIERDDGDQRDNQ